MKTNEKEGFSLIELLVALSILAVVAAIIVPRFLNVRQSAAITTAQASISQFAQSVKQFLSLGGTIGGSATGGDVAQFLTTVANVAGGSPVARNASVANGGNGLSLNGMADSTGQFGSGTVSINATLGYGAAAPTTSTNPPGFYCDKAAGTAGAGLYYVDGAGDVWTVGVAAATGTVTVGASAGTAPSQTTF